MISSVFGNKSDALKHRESEPLHYKIHPLYKDNLSCSIKTKIIQQSLDAAELYLTLKVNYGMWLHIFIICS